MLANIHVLDKALELILLNPLVEEYVVEGTNIYS